MQMASTCLVIEENNEKLEGSKYGCSASLAPEVFVGRRFDPRSVDMWPFAIMYTETKTGKYFWNLATEGADECYDKYLQDRKGLWGYGPIENLKNVSYSFRSPTRLTTSSKTAGRSCDICWNPTLGDV